MPVPDGEVFRQLIDQLPFGAYFVGLDRKFLYWNVAAERITGYLAQEVIGHCCGEEFLLHCAADGTAFCRSSCLFASTLRDGKPFETRVFVLHKSGHRIPVSIRSFPLCGNDGKIVAVAELFQQDTVEQQLNWVRTRSGHLCDSLGIPSAEATEIYLRSSLWEKPQQFAIYLIEIEEMHDLARHGGAEMAHALLRTLVQTVTRLVRTPHFLGCWTGDRLLLLVRDCTPEAFSFLLLELEGVGSATSISWWGDRIEARVSVSGTLAREEDRLETVMARLDEHFPTRRPNRLPMGEPATCL